MLGLTPGEFRTLARLNTPRKIQDFLDAIPQNFEPDGDTVLSVREVLAQRRAHCIEGAVVAACALWINGEPPLLMDLTATRDYDHEITLFRRNGAWGAFSKTNAVYLRYREPVYRTLRELAMSYFHEYSNKRHQRTLRTYSKPFDLRRIDPKLWVSGKDAWEVAYKVCDWPHYDLITRRQEKALIVRPKIEREGSKLLQYPRPEKK